MQNFLDYNGVRYLWSKISMEDYPNNETLVAILNAIDETKQNKIDDNLITSNNSIIEAINEIYNKHSIHEESLIYSENGAHGLRFKEYDFEINIDGEWQKPPKKIVMTLSIDLSNSNPSTCCTYENDAANMTAGSEAWDEFFGHYPVLMKDGQEVVKLNPNNFSQDINGNSVDITSGNAGDVMIAFPRRGLKISTTGDTLKISFVEHKNDSDYQYYAHTYNGKSLEKFYIGAYEGYVSDNKLRSISGQKPTTNITITDTRTAARANGSGYEQWAFYQLLYIQCMFAMKYKSLSAQTVLGRGRVDYSSSSTTSNAGTAGETNTKGMDFGDQTGENAMKFAGIENLWGSLYTWVDGCQTNSSRAYQILKSGTFGSSNSSDYITISASFSSNTSAYLTKPIGTSEHGFLFTNSSGGSSSTYFCDRQYCNASAIANQGGNWATGDDAGPFFISFYDSTTTSVVHAGGRLMYLGV